MLPVTHSENQQEASKRQANYILLRYLESAVNQDLFNQVLEEVSARAEFPKRIDWTGAPQNLSFDELKINFSHIDSSYLPLSWNTAANNKNMLLMLRSSKLGNLGVDQKMVLKKDEISRFERMKTIFGHALPDAELLTSIYNLQFDQENKFIISGADDGMVKIWDKDTLQIQASLHGHQDYITDIDVSKCNKYIASASKDGQIIIWDLKKCEMIDRLPSHNSSVNNIKFFRHRPKKDSSGNRNQQLEEIEMLVTCSDDGSIKIYDEHGYLQSQHSNSQDVIARRSRRQDIGIKKERFCLSLTSEDYRPGSRNKKIESVTLNQAGLIAAGTNAGDIFLWQIDFAQFKRQTGKIANWLGSFKKHTKNVHFCEFSPTGKFLFTGSVDGTAKVWNVEHEKQSTTESSGQKQLLQLNPDRLKVTLEEKRSNCCCDCITWSAYGRYAIAAFSGRVEEQKMEASFIKIWDSFTNQVTQDLTQGLNIQLKNYTFVLAPHPKIEEYLMSGSDGGLIILWNIRTKEILKKFIEYGVYSQDRYTFNIPFDGKFTKDGQNFVIGSNSGTISIYSNDYATHKYAATRVEQFYNHDNTMHGENIYQNLQEDEVPQVCAFNMIPYEIQPPKPLIGKYKENFQHRNLQNNIQYERNFLNRQELGIEEENFIQNLLEEGLRQDLFNQQAENADEPEPMIDEEEDDLDIRPPVRRQRIDSVISQNEQNLPNNQAEQENVDRRRAQNQGLVQNGNNQRNGRGRPRGGNRGRGSRYPDSLTDNDRIRIQGMRRLNPNYDPENSLYDRDSDENFELDGIDDDEEEEESYSVSQQSIAADQGANRFRRENYHSQQQNRVEERKRNQMELYQKQREEEKKKQEQGRNERAKRRQKRLNFDEDEEEDEKEIRQDNRSKKRRAHISDEEEDNNDDEQDSEEYGYSDIEPKQQRKRLVKQNRKEKTNNGSYDESEPEESNHLLSSFYQPQFNILVNKVTKNSRSQRKEKGSSKNVSSTRQGRRGDRVRYDNMDDSSDEMADILDEQQKNMHLLQADKYENNKNKRVVEDDSEEEEKEQIAEDDAAYDNSKIGKGDEDYELVMINQGSVQLEENMIENLGLEKKCGFCMRVDPPLVGPFLKTRNAKNQPPLYFHKDCIEVNKYSFFNKAKGKWLNIGKALEMLVKKKSQICKRCAGLGATIKCNSCNKWYHGYLCSSLYMIWLGKQDYECFECRNSDNFSKFQLKPPKIDDKDNETILKSMPRDHLIASKVDLVSSYMPQINDLVYYFFQGHERFINNYNCFFYAGDDEEITFNYPWDEIPELQQPMLCRIKNMSFHYPSRNTLQLLKFYGKGSSQVIQTPQIIIHLDIQVLQLDEKTFTVSFFPNDLPDFLVLKNVYERSLSIFEDLIEQNKFKGNIFKTKCKNFRDVKIVDVRPKEPTMFPHTSWETILYLHQEYQGLRDRGRRQQINEQDQDYELMAELISFWELLLTDEVSEVSQQSAFELQEQERLANIIRDFQPNKRDNIEMFRKRVTEDLAPDYKCHVPAEMFLELVESRLRNSYYRSQEQLFFDLDLISYNSSLFNGDSNPITLQAKRIVEQIRIQLKLNINSNGGDKKGKKEDQHNSKSYEKPAGKLTAPPRFTTYKTTMEEFQQQMYQQQQQQEIEQQAHNRLENQTLIRIPNLQEEIKVPNNKYTKRNGNKAFNHYQNQDSEDENIQMESAESSDFKCNPKNQIPIQISYQNSGSRKSTRTQNRKNYNETVLERGDDTGEKVSFDDSMLGKRSRKVKSSALINGYEEEDDIVDQHPKIVVQPHNIQALPENNNVNTNSRYPKRIRN